MVKAKKNDDAIASLALQGMLRATEKLRAAPKPLSYGAGQSFQQYIPKKSPDQILEDETSPYWWAYAEALREFGDELKAAPITPFVAKKVK